MTVIEPPHFQKTAGRLRDRGYDVHHFALLAERNTVLRRLRKRRFGTPRSSSWASGGCCAGSFTVSNLDRGMEQLRVPMSAEQLWTDELTIPEVAIASPHHPSCA